MSRLFSRTTTEGSRRPPSVRSGLNAERAVSADMRLGSADGCEPMLWLLSPGAASSRIGRVG
ncbi:hypothetical protein [Streptomyces flavidovirens]|uniref:Uncharacterized protein n=1 Tax=Streptomyces flavidovirens TaxID=67298 RepID=A0ABW6RLU5_9ACTN